MPVPWWQRIIDPEALRALVILAGVFLVGRWWERHIRTTWHRWRGFRLVRVEGPWPIHLVLGFLTVDVMR